MVDVADDVIREGGVEIHGIHAGEGLSAYVDRVSGGVDVRLFRQLIGAANPFKPGDAAIGVAARDTRSRELARTLLANTRLVELHDRPLFEDAVQRLIWTTIDVEAYQRVRGWTLGQLREFLLVRDAAEIGAVLGGLDSDAIACVVKLLSDDELIALGGKLFHRLPGTNIGAPGYLGARIQPNSPTDHPEDILWQVLSGFAYAVGDVLLGTNPVDSTPESVARVQRVLRDVLETFGLLEVLPHCVLSHIDVQAEVERRHPGLTALWFQSLAGTDSANRTFDLSVDKMLRHAAARTGRFGLYLETGQGADFTNGHGHGFDMVVHESRKYGFARALRQKIAAVVPPGQEPWLHLNDVAGFIGPEVFETREQLVRTCLEDIAMGKLHGLTIGLDICSTLHMKVSLDDLTWCIDQILPANPAYLMALPTRNDPMLSYLTTSFQDHVRIRERFGFRVDDRMWAFFQRLGVIDAQGRPAAGFGDPLAVFEVFQREKGDLRPRAEIRAEGARRIAEVEARGVPIAWGHGEHPHDLREDLDRRVRALYDDAKRCVFAELTGEFVTDIPDAMPLASRSADRRDFVARPVSGEHLAAAAEAALDALCAGWSADPPDVVIVISDGLNPHALMDDGHLLAFLPELDRQLRLAGIGVARPRIVLRHGRVRAGYRCGERLFCQAQDDKRRAVVHVIGERPGSGHHNFSVYLVAAPVWVWRQPGTVDHDTARVVSGISDTALAPADAAVNVVKLLRELLAP